MVRFNLALLLASVAVASPLNCRSECEHCEDVAHGFASLNGGTTGGKGGRIVVARSHNELKTYAAANEPLIIRIEGEIRSEPKGYEIPVKANKTIIGVGDSAKLLGGGFLIQNTKNIILRNFQISDTWNPTDDWAGKGEDWDGVQVDTSTNIWIDHMRFARMLDGLIDLRRDTSYVTVSNTLLTEHNKAFGIGWTQNVTAAITVNDCWFNGTTSRNPSADNIDMAHFYNNYFLNIETYGTYSRGHTRLLVESSYYENVNDPLVAGPNGTIRSNWNIYKHCTGSKMENVNPEKVFKASDYYEYKLRDPYDVPNDIKDFSGPQPEIGQ